MVQDVFNLLPNLSVDELLTSFAVKSNDMMLAVYLASMIRRYMPQVDCTDVPNDKVIAMCFCAHRLCLFRICHYHVHNLLDTCWQDIRWQEKFVLRSVLALHNLIDNQEQRVWQEKLGQKRPELANGKVGNASSSVVTCRHQPRRHHVCSPAKQHTDTQPCQAVRQTAAYTILLIIYWLQAKEGKSADKQDANGKATADKKSSK